MGLFDSTTLFQIPATGKNSFARPLERPGSAGVLYSRRSLTCAHGVAAANLSKMGNIVRRHNNSGVAHPVNSLEFTEGNLLQ